MRKLFYATFERGFGDVAEQVIKKYDKTSHIKSVFNDAVLFFADEKFNFANSLFLENYTVFDHSKKEGNGAINAEMKNLLEKKGFKISFTSDVKKFKLTFLKYSDKLLIDQNLRNAFEIMLKKITHKQIGFYDTDAELVLMAKEEGDCLFMKKNKQNSELLKLAGYEISPQTAFVMNFLSCPVEKEVSLDPFAGSGLISYIRALCFKKSNVIAVEPDAGKVALIKKLAKSLKDKTFSVMKYKFLSEIFPIRFIDKIVTVPPTDKKEFSDFLRKCYVLKVKKVVILTKFKDVKQQARDMFEIEEQFCVGGQNIYVLTLDK